MNELVKVSVIPNSPSQLENKLFFMGGLAGAHAENVHWMQPFALLRLAAIKENIQIDTCDILPPAESDIVIFMELPKSPNVMSAMKRNAPALKTILMPMETPLGREYLFNVQNYEKFDAVLTYNDKLVANERCFHFNLPVADSTYVREGKAFIHRKAACIISTNSTIRWKTGINVVRSGWNFSVHNWIDYAFSIGQTAELKRSVAKEFERYKPNSLDIYGDGWSNYSWGVSDRLLQRNTFLCEKGRINGSKLNTLGEYKFNICYENCINDCGYISEKIFDAFYGDTVPVYFGNKSIASHVSKDCFVDARDFPSEKKLVDFIVNCPEKIWRTYREAGKQFLNSHAAKKFQPPAFIDDFLRPIRLLGGRE